MLKLIKKLFIINKKCKTKTSLSYFTAHFKTLYNIIILYITNLTYLVKLLLFCFLPLYLIYYVFYILFIYVMFRSSELVFVNFSFTRDPAIFYLPKI